MADVITRLKVDSSEYDNKLKRAVSSFKQLASAAKESGSGFNDASSKLMSVVKNLGNMETVSSSAKAQMREYQNAVVDLTMMYRSLSDEERNSAVGKEMANQIAILTEKAGEAKDAMMDVSAAITNAASDTRAFDQVSQGMSFMTSTLQTGIGVAKLLGLNIGDDVQVIAKLQSAMAVTSGLMQVQNSLQKQSALMQGVSTLQKKALAAAEGLDTAAKSGNIVVTKAATVAQAALNAVAKANPYTLLATAVVGVGVALAGYSVASSKSKEEEKAHQEEIKRTNKAIQEKNEAMKKASDQYAESVAKIKLYVLTAKNENASLKERNEACKELNKMEPSIGAAINKTTGAFEAQAGAIDTLISHLTTYYKMLAAQDYLQELYKKQIGLEINKKNFEKWVGSATIDWNKAKKDMEKNAEVNQGANAFTPTNVQGIRESDASVYENMNRQQKRLDDSTRALNNTVKELGIVNNDISVAESVFADLTAQNGGFTPASASSATKNKSGKQTTKKENVENPLKNISLDDLQIAYETALEDGNVEVAKHLMKEIQSRKIDYNPLSNIDPFNNPDTSSIMNEVNGYSLPEMSGVLSEDSSSLTSYISSLSQIRDLYSDFPDVYEAVTNKLYEAYQAQTNLNGSFKECLELDMKDYTNSITDAYGNVTNAIGGIGTIVNEVGEAIKTFGDDSKSVAERIGASFKILSGVFSGIVSVVSSVQDAVKSFSDASAAASAVNAAAKQTETQANVGEAVSEGAVAMGKAASSGAALPFPANIAAIAAGVAAVTAVIASIFSIVGSFAEGGVIGGNIKNGDVQLARVNSGEMILNENDTSRLYNAIHNGALGVGGSTGTSAVGVRVTGESLYTCLDNHMRRTGKKLPS